MSLEETMATLDKTRRQIASSRSHAATPALYIQRMTGTRRNIAIAILWLISSDFFKILRLRNTKRLTHHHRGPSTEYEAHDV